MDHCNLHNEQPGVVTTVMHVFIALALAFSIRIFMWLKFSSVITLQEADGIGYICIARNMIENLSISNATHFPPFYPALIAIFSLLTGNYENGARITSIFMGSSMVIPYYFACRYLMSARGAFCGALFASSFWAFVNCSFMPVALATYIFLIALGTWFALRCFNVPSLLSLAAFGMTSAAIYLTRPEGILFFAFNFPLLAYAVYRDHDTLKHRLNHISALFLSFFLPFIWYVICLKRYTGYWTISGKSGVTTIGVDASMKLLPGGKTYGEVIAGNAGLVDLVPSLSGFMKTYMIQLGKFSTVAVSALPGIMFVVAATGLAVCFFELFYYERNERIRAISMRCLFLSPLVVLLPVMAFNKLSIWPGYILPLFMVCLGCAAKGIVWLECRISEWFGKRFSISIIKLRNIPLAVVSSILLSWFLYMPLYRSFTSVEVRFDASKQDFLLRQTGYWFKNHTEKTAKFMARWSNISYYSERSWSGLVDGSISDVIGYAKRHGVTHIVIDSYAVPKLRPLLKDLLDPSVRHPGLTPLYGEELFGLRVIIYQVD